MSHTHHHPHHEHQHDHHAHHRHEHGPAVAHAAQPWSLLRLSALARIGVVGVLLCALWALVYGVMG